jgi:hypothetical protein
MKGALNTNMHIAGCYSESYPYPSFAKELFPEQYYLLLPSPIITCLKGEFGHIVYLYGRNTPTIISYLW